MSTGRPSRFTEEIADAICERLADGESLRTICLSDEMPHKATVFRWLGDDRYASFRDQYARAREAQGDAYADEIIDIADDGSNDWMESREDGDATGWKINGEHIQRSRVRIDSRKWLAGKLKPKVYGDKTLLGSDPDNPLP